MKLIKLGRKQKGWSKELVCTGAGNGGGGCNSTLLVEQPDLYRTGRHSYDGSSDYFVTFTCSNCGVETDLSNPPGHLFDVIPSKRPAQTKESEK